MVESGPTHNPSLQHRPRCSANCPCTIGDIVPISSSGTTVICASVIYPHPLSHQFSTADRSPSKTPWLLASRRPQPSTLDTQHSIIRRLVERDDRLVASRRE